VEGVVAPLSLSHQVSLAKEPCKNKALLKKKEIVI